MHSFPDLEPVCCSISSSNCCFLPCIQISQEVGKVVWYSHLFQNFPQCVVIHTVKGFGIVNKAEIDVFLELSCFFNDPVDVGNLISGSSVFCKSRLNIWKFMVHIMICHVLCIEYLKEGILVSPRRQRELQAWQMPLLRPNPMNSALWSQEVCYSRAVINGGSVLSPPGYQTEFSHLLVLRPWAGSLLFLIFFSLSN